MYVPRRSSDRRKSRSARAQAFRRDDRASGPDHAGRRLGRRPAGVEADDGRALEDPDAALDERSPEPPRESGRVHGRGMADPEARPNDGRVEALADLARGHRPVHVGEPQTLRLRHGLSDRGVVRRARRHAEIAGRLVPGVDAGVLAPRPDLVDGSRRRLDRPPPTFAVTLEQEAGLVVQPVDEPAVASARSTAADVALEEHHVQGRFALLEEPRGPHPRVPAAEDDDVGGDVPLERGRLGSGELGQRERLLEPPAPPSRSGDVEVPQRGPRL